MNDNEPGSSKAIDSRIDRLRKTGEHLDRELNQLANRLEESGDDVDVKEVAQPMKVLALAYVDIEEAAAMLGVIDAESAPYRAIDSARTSAYKSAQAVCYTGDVRDMVEPTEDDYWNDAIASATSAAEYAEAARDGDNR
jgi:hypothetical protein